MVIGYWLLRLGLRLRSRVKSREGFSLSIRVESQESRVDGQESRVKSREALTSFAGDYPGRGKAGHPTDYTGRGKAGHRALARL